jgi:hypothetical protein
MMRVFLATTLTILPPIASAQSADVPKTLTLVGCVQRDGSRPADWFTLWDAKSGTTYHLTGPKVKAFVWRNVRIVGGLVPTPNIAAQAGGIDQTKAAMAFEGHDHSSIRMAEERELRVRTIKPLTGSCSPR